MGGAARPRGRPGRRPGRPRRAARGHRRPDARQPAGVRDRRPRRDDARGDAVLDLPDLHPGADRLRGRGRRRARGDRRGAVPRALPRGARRAAGARARHRGGGRAWRRHPGLGRRRGRRSGVRSGAALARGRAGGRGDADLHVGHHRAAQGRPDRAPQPARGRPRGGRDHPLPRRLARDLVAARGAHRRADGAPLPADRVRHDRDHVPEPARDRRLSPGGQADVVLRRPADLREAQGGARGPPAHAGRPDRGLAGCRAAAGGARAGRRAGPRRRRRDRRRGR